MERAPAVSRIKHGSQKYSFNNKDVNAYYFFKEFATSLLCNMGPVNNIKVDVSLSIMRYLMNYKFYSQQLQGSIKHKIEFIQHGKKFLTFMSYSNSYIEWHAMNVSNFFMFITNRKQDSLISACFDNLQNYTKKGYKTSCQEIAGGSVEQKCFRMMNILLQLWPGNLASQMKNLNNEIESNWKKAFSHPENTKLVHKNKRDASLLPCYICLFAGPTTCGTRAA